VANVSLDKMVNNIGHHRQEATVRHGGNPFDLVALLANKLQVLKKPAEITDPGTTALR
jgi:hypothetical protein